MGSVTWPVCGSGLVRLCGPSGESKHQRTFEAALANLFPGVVGAPHQWTRLDVPETQLHTGPLQIGEFLRGDVTFDGKVFLRGAKILAEGQYVTLDFTQVAHHLEQFVASLAEAKHDSRFGEEVSFQRSRALFRVA